MMDHLEDKLGEMLSQVAKDLVMVSAALRNDDCEEEPVHVEKVSSSKNLGTQRMRGVACGVLELVDSTS